MRRVNVGDSFVVFIVHLDALIKTMQMLPSEQHPSIPLDRVLDMLKRILVSSSTVEHGVGRASDRASFSTQSHDLAENRIDSNTGVLAEA